jgi:hypothetical protein
MGVITALLCWPAPSLAYRPFDGTDASVADLGELETEVQPGGALWEGSQTTLIAPDLVFNFGFQENWEATLEGRLETPVSPAEPPRITDAALLVKGVLRPGGLQDKQGPSIATEFGLLLPNGSGESGVGASLAGIASERWDWGRFTSMLRRRSRPSSTPTYSSARSSRVRLNGKFGPSPRCSMKITSAKLRRSLGWQGRYGRSAIILLSMLHSDAPSPMGGR